MGERPREHWYVRRRFAHAGPYTSEMVADMLFRGDVTGRDRLRRDGSWTWSSFATQVDFEVAQGAVRLGFARSTPRSHAYATAVTQSSFLTMVSLVALAVSYDRDLPLAPALVTGVALPLVGFAAGLRGRAPWLLKRCAMRRVGLHARLRLYLDNTVLLLVAGVLATALVLPSSPI